MSNPSHCPECKTDLDGGPIPENIREHYSPPYRWSRVIALIDRDKDRQTHWICPDCKHKWPVHNRRSPANEPD